MRADREGNASDGELAVLADRRPQVRYHFALVVAPHDLAPFCIADHDLLARVDQVALPRDRNASVDVIT